MNEGLVVWLLEQIAEDEAIAQALPESPRLGGRPSRPGETYRGPSHGLSAFIRTISPARVLAECDAKWKTIQQYLAAEVDPTAAPMVQAMQRAERSALLEVLRRWAAIYDIQGRTGYREEWSQ